MQCAGAYKNTVHEMKEFDTFLLANYLSPVPRTTIGTVKSILIDQKKFLSKS